MRINPLAVIRSKCVPFGLIKKRLSGRITEKWLQTPSCILSRAAHRNTAARSMRDWMLSARLVRSSAAEWVVALVSMGIHLLQPTAMTIAMNIGGHKRWIAGLTSVILWKREQRSRGAMRQAI